jgi:hypothetical protein
MKRQTSKQYVLSKYSKATLRPPEPNGFMWSMYLVYIPNGGGILSCGNTEDEAWDNAKKKIMEQKNENTTI